MIVLLDTNFLLVPHQFKVDIFSEIERLVPETHTLATLSTVVEELNGLAGTSTRDKVAAKVALALIGHRGIMVLPAEGEADESIIEFAKANETLVATNDRDLKRRLKPYVKGAICMRGRSHLERI
jgi:uncharacterized protein